MPLCWKVSSATNLTERSARDAEVIVIWGSPNNLGRTHYLCARSCEIQVGKNKLEIEINRANLELEKTRLEVDKLRLELRRKQVDVDELTSRIAKPSKNEIRWMADEFWKKGGAWAAQVRGDQREQDWSMLKEAFLAVMQSGERQSSIESSLDSLRGEKALRQRADSRAR